MPNGTPRNYHLIILALIAILAVGCSSDDAVTTPDTTPPPPVDSFTITIGDGSVTLGWANPQSDFDHIQIRRSETGPVTPDTGVVVYQGSSTNTYVDTGLTNGTTYYYGFIVFDAAGNRSSVVDAVASLPAVEAVTFGDPNLEQAVRDALSLPPGDIMTTDLLPLVFLESTHTGISDLSGLEYCVNLKTLKLGSNDLADDDLDILPLLANLVELDLSDNGLTVMPDLAAMPRLSDLSVGGNTAIVSIGTAGAIPSLNLLDITMTAITDLGPLSGAASLGTLIFHETSISDLTPLAGLNNLHNLSFNNARVSDLGPLSGLTKMTTLTAYGNLITDLTPLAGLTALKDVELGNNDIHDLQALVDNTGLGAGDRVRIRNTPLLHDALTVQIPALQGRGVEMTTSDGLPAELVGTWFAASVTVNGVAQDLGDFFDWDTGSVATHLWIYYNSTYLSRELDAQGGVVYYDSGTAVVDGDNLTVASDNDNGTPVEPPEVNFQGTWAVIGGNVVMTMVDGDDTIVMTWAPLP